MSRENPFFKRKGVVVSEVALASFLASGVLGSFLAGVAEKVVTHETLFDCPATGLVDKFMFPLEHLGYAAAGGQLLPCDPTTPPDISPNTVPQSLWQAPENQANELA